MSEPVRENVALTNDKGNAPVCHRSRDCEVKNDTRSWVFPLPRSARSGPSLPAPFLRGVETLGCVYTAGVVFVCTAIGCIP